MSRDEREGGEGETKRSHAFGAFAFFARPTPQTIGAACANAYYE